MPTNKIIERIEAELGITGLVETLAARLTPTDLQSVLLEVYRQAATQRTPAEVLMDYEKNRFARPSTVDPLRIAAWEQTAFKALPDGFRVVALSPVCPLGTVSTLGGLDQNWTLTTSRNTEVLSDSTNVLALEAAVQRRQLQKLNPKSKEVVSVAASHRLLRTQHYNNPRFVPHFSAFALCSAGQDQGNLRFELEALVTHIGFYLRALRSYAGATVPLRVALTDFGTTDRRTVLTEQVLSPLRQQFVDVDCIFDEDRASGRGYYAALCFHVYAAAPSGVWLELADGGVVDWTQKLLSNAKERCVISGIGAERVCVEF